MGAKKAKALFYSADRLIFESDEYCEYWSKYYSNLSTIVADTPQHECIYITPRYKEKSIIWVGSPHTASHLIHFIEYFKIFNEYGYKIKLFGVPKDVSGILRDGLISFSVIEIYDAKILSAELELAFISFVPMPSEELFQFRGNLKAKLSMGYGCLTIASRISMHERLITHGVNGYLFESLEGFQLILDEIENGPLASNIAFQGNKYVANTFSRKEHAMRLVQIAGAL